MTDGTTIRIKIPGDVNGDNVVDIFDIGEVSAHWYPGPPTPKGFANGFNTFLLKKHEMRKMALKGREVMEKYYRSIRSIPSDNRSNSPHTRAKTA